MPKKILSLFSKIALSVVIVAGIYCFCNWQTQGFRTYLILSNLPNDPRWEMPQLSLEEDRNLRSLLDQPFTFIGKGGWCFAFLGADQTTVLKFYRHDHLKPLSLVTEFSWHKLLHHCPMLAQGTSYFQEFNFSSCVLLHHQLKHRTGLLYAHLNKAQDHFGTVTLIDKIGIRHQIDLDRTEFVIQRKAVFLVDYIAEVMAKNDLKKAQQIIDDYLGCLTELCTSGIRDLDRKFKDNYGVIDERVVTLDISSFVTDPSLKQPAPAKKEIILKSHAFAKWLSKKYPDLFTYLDNRLTELLEKEDLT